MKHKRGFKTYRIEIYDKDVGKIILKEVSGKPITIPGYKKFNFFIYRCCLLKAKWALAEERTGIPVKHDLSCATQKQTILEAMQFLKQNLSPAEIAKQLKGADTLLTQLRQEDKK